MTWNLTASGAEGEKLLDEAGESIFATKVKALIRDLREVFDHHSNVIDTVEVTHDGASVLTTPDIKPEIEPIPLVGQASTAPPNPPEQTAPVQTEVPAPT